MPFTFLLVIAVAALGTLSLRWKALWQAKQVAPSLATETRPAEQPTLPRARLAQGITTLRNKLPFISHRPDLSQRFRVWTRETFAHEEALNQWLSALSPDAHKAFTQQVAEFCDEMGFALTDLIDGELAEIPATAQQAQTIVLQYCRANQQAALAQDDFDAAKQFLAYLRAPTHKANLHFGQRLYGKLIEEKLVPPPSFDMMLASEEKRRANSLAAIHHAASQQPAAFNAVLKAVALDGIEPVGDSPASSTAQRMEKMPAAPAAEPTDPANQLAAKPLEEEAG